MLIVCPNSGIDIQYKIEDFTSHNRVKNVIKQPGGKGFNVQRVLKQLGYDATLVTFTGSYNGQFIKDKSKEENLAVITTRIENDNRICLNIIGDKPFEILEDGPVISDAEVNDYVNNIVNLSRTEEYVLFSGSQPKSSKSIYKQIADAVESKVIIDTSSSSLFDCYSEDVFGLKINNFEFEELCKHLNIDGTIEEKILKLKNELVVITLGSKGSLVKFYGELYSVVIPNYVIMNTTGSGDSFFAGLCFALVNGYNVEETLKLANACGILNALEEKTGYINTDQIEEVSSSIIIKKLRRCNDKI